MDTPDMKRDKCKSMMTYNSLSYRLEFMLLFFLLLFLKVSFIPPNCQREPCLPHGGLWNKHCSARIYCKSLMYSENTANMRYYKIPVFIRFLIELAAVPVLRNT